jgi:hypothetical protein
MMRLVNRSPFPTELLAFPEADGQEVELLVFAATYAAAKGGGLTPAPEQRPVPVADAYFGDPEASSVRYEAAVAIEKPMIDVLVNGTAYSPGGRAVAEVVVELRAGEIRKSARVLGDRFQWALGASSPEPFVSKPVIYERAFGGSVKSDKGDQAVCRTNPVGVGFRGARSMSPEVLTEYPNVEFIDREPSESPPAGFGIISRAWSPRLEWAGTFDEAWKQNQWPLLPHDFDARHYQAAPEDQQVESLKPGDPIRLVNFTPDGFWEFPLPHVELPVWLFADRDASRQTRPRLDTILIEPDSLTITLIFRLKLLSQRGRSRWREAVVGPVPPGFIRSREKRKPYLDLRASGKGLGGDA